VAKTAKTQKDREIETRVKLEMDIINRDAALVASLLLVMSELFTAREEFHEMHASLGGGKKLLRTLVAVRGFCDLTTDVLAEMGHHHLRPRGESVGEMATKDALAFLSEYDGQTAELLAKHERLREEGRQRYLARQERVQLAESA
jgi:hypothetical protein